MIYYSIPLDSQPDSLEILTVYVAHSWYIDRQQFDVLWLLPRPLCEIFSANNLCDWQMTKKWKVKRLEDFRIGTDRRGTERKTERKTIYRADVLLLHALALSHPRGRSLQGCERGEH